MATVPNSELSSDQHKRRLSHKTGMEAADIVEDALQLAVDDELKEEREDIIIADKSSSSKVNNKSSRNERNERIERNEVNRYKDDGEGSVCGLPSPPKPETAPVVAPLTVEDTLNLVSTKKDSSAVDDASLIVNVDDTQTDLLDDDFDVPNISAASSLENECTAKGNSADNKSSFEANSSTESKTDSGNDKDLNPSSNVEDTNNFNSSKEFTKDSDNKDSSSKFKSSITGKDKIKKKDSKNPNTALAGASNGRNIWVSGLSQSTKASELQTLFSNHGKVVSAKIIKNTRLPASMNRCYGFITMENSDEVNKCINHLNKTELHGKTISLSRNRPQETPSKATAINRKTAVVIKRDVTKKTPVKSGVKEVAKDVEIKDVSNKESEVSEEKEMSLKDKKEDKDLNKSDDGSNDRSLSKEIRKPIRPPFRDFKDRGMPFRRPIFNFRRPIPIRRPFMPHMNPNFRTFRRPTFARPGIRTAMPMKRLDLDRNLRERERERQMREEKRRREEFFRVQRDLEREERIRFEKEKERLKFERLKLEREKAEFFRYERERTKLEREKIEREREELRRRQTIIPLQHRVEESRTRSAIVASAPNKRPFDNRDMRGNDNYWEERKRLQSQTRVESHIIPGRQAFVDTAANARNSHISHGYDNRNEAYKRGRIDMPMAAGSRSEFDARRHDARHGGGHDRDERKGGNGPSGGSYYRDSSRGMPFVPRERRFSMQREEWKSSHDSRRERYNEKPMTGGSNTGFGGTSRYAGGDTRGWNDRGANSMNKMSYGSGNVHFTGNQPWNSSSGDRWNSAIGSSQGESRSRGQQGLNSMLSGTSSSLNEIFGSSPLPGLGMSSMGSNMSGSDRQYVHNNRRF